MMSDVSNLNLQEYTRLLVRSYLHNLKGHQANNLNNLIIHEVEIGLILEVLSFTKGNLTEASVILGITRTTLRNKIRKHKL
jgi:Fis family transcriptional regulator